MKHLAKLAITLGFFFMVAQVKVVRCPTDDNNLHQVCYKTVGVLPPQGPFNTLAACQQGEADLLANSTNLIAYSDCQ